MTLLQLRSMMAAYLQKSVPDLMINGADLSLLALNNVRRTAEMLHDFEFTSEACDGDDGRDERGDAWMMRCWRAVPTCEVKSVIECGIYDDEFNMQPVEWTTVAESIERQRQMKPGFGPRYPTDWEATTRSGGGLNGQRIAFVGNDIWCVPTMPGGTFDLELEVYTFQQDWTSTSDSVIVEQLTNPTGANGSYWPYGIYNQRPLYINILYGPPAALYVIWWDGVGEWRVTPMADLGKPTVTNYMGMTAQAMVPGGAYVMHGSWTATASAGIAVVEMMPGSDTSDVWLTKGAQYLMWAGIVEVNHLAKEFVFRQEGNLPPPEKLAETALETFRQWDAFKYEQSRRHVY